MKIIPAYLNKAVLVRRINRFVAEVLADNIMMHVYVPNTGRLSELALPGSEVLLSPINAKYKYKILYIINRSFPVMIDSAYSNRLFHDLLKRKKVPNLGHFVSIKSEPAYGSHRFDFLLENGDDRTYIELKSCTLFHNSIGAFPDAVSTRASEHIKALAETGKGLLVFFVLKDSIEKFIPNYHTDFTFYETLKYYKDRINIRALTVQYDDNLNILSLKDIPVIIPEVKPGGLFLLILYNPADEGGNEGKILRKGYYIYCGYSAGNVFKTIAAIKKKGVSGTILPGIRFSRIKIISDIPIVTPDITAEQVNSILVKHGGTLTSTGNEHNDLECINVIHYETDPSKEPWFWETVLDLRFGEYS